MTTLKIGDVLQQAQLQHERLARHYGELQAQADSERLRLLCDYLAGHEQALAEALSRYVADASPHVLNAWLSHVPDERALGAGMALTVPSPLTAETVLAAARQYDDCFQTFFRAMAEAAQHNDARDAFASLMRMEEQEKHRHALSLQTLYDW